MFRLYVVNPACPLVVNTAWLPLQVDSVHPGLVEVIFVVLTVEQSMFSFQLMVTVLFKATPVAPFAGMVVLIAGPVLSTVTVLPAPGVSMLLEVSVALL